MTTPGPATNLHVVKVEATEVTLAWTAPKVIVAPGRYRVRYRPAKTTSWIMFPTVTTATTMTVTGLSPATSYQFEVLASNGH